MERGVLFRGLPRTAARASVGNYLSLFKLMAWELASGWLGRSDPFRVVSTIVGQQFGSLIVS